VAAVDDANAGDMPAAGDGFLYLVRAANACGVADYGSGLNAGSPDPRTALDGIVPCP
jgi:hypothetical protein